MIAACEGYLTSAYLALWDLEVWELIEALEIVTALQERAKEAT